MFTRKEIFIKKNYLNKQVKDNFHAFLVKEATFTPNEEYPILKREFISNEIPKKIIPFDKSKEIKMKDRKNYYVCFYCADETFNKTYTYPKKYLNYLSTFAGVITQDWSIHEDLPIIKQKENMNKNLEIAYYYGSNGLSIIPNIRVGTDRIKEEYYKTIPKHSTIAIGTYGFIKSIKEQENFDAFIEDIIHYLEPHDIIVYGAMPKRVFDKYIKYGIRFHQYDPYITTKLGDNHDKQF